MSTTIDDILANAATAYEGLPRAATQAAARAESTEYERVGHRDPNLKDPDAPVGNGSRQALADEIDVAGHDGESATAGAEAADGPVPDALLGSYPEAARALDAAEVIIGSDDRIRIGATTNFPWRAICALRITAANGRRFIGTGWLIGPRTVITAGHCVFMHDEGGWARSIEVIPGLNDAARPYDSATSSVLRSVSGWTSGRSREHDYGAIILPPTARLGDRTGWFGFATRTDAFLSAAALNLSGYPGDKGGAQQWFMAQKTKSVSSRVITYDIDTMGGQSGSPVWVLQNGQRYAVGIHTNGAGTGNSATRIESNVHARLTEWKALGA